MERLKVSIAEDGDVQVRRALPENHSGIWLSGLLKDAGIDSCYLDGMQVGVKTNRSGKVLSYASSFEIRNALKKHMGKGKIPVVGGYIGRRQDNGEPITLGRNTTDVTGSVVSFALSSKYEIIKDVPGVYRIEPVIKVNGKTIKIETDFLRHISYEEATQIAWRGSKVVHPHAIDIARDGNIPIRIKCIGPGDGTLITDVSDTTPDKPIAAISTGSFYLLSVNDSELTDLREATKYCDKILKVLAELNVGIFDQARSPSVITFAVPSVYDGEQTNMNYITKTLRGSLVDIGKNPRHVKHSDVFGMSFTGGAMKGTPGVTARITEILRREGVSIVMGGQTDETEGSPVINYYMDPNHAERAARALCAELF